MPKGVPINLVGHRFGRLVVVRKLRAQQNGTVWFCQCDCGGTAERQTGSLKARRIAGCNSCAPERTIDVHIKHGGSPRVNPDRLYSVWLGMRDRCSNPKNQDYGIYGGKGIVVCQEWLDYAAFRAWATSKGYAKGLTLDRVDPNKDYSPDNCEWVTASENSKRMWRTMTPEAKKAGSVTRQISRKRNTVQSAVNSGEYLLFHDNPLRPYTPPEVFGMLS